MYINRALLLVMGITFILFPMIQEWISQSGAQWYRPYQVWLLIIIATYWNQRSRPSDEL
jgi:hypothetical protein